MTDAPTLTDTQLAAVWSFMIHGDIRRKPDGSWSSGNAQYRMRDRMHEAGLWAEYDRSEKDRPALLNDGPTVAALRLFLTDPRAEKRGYFTGKGEGIREKIETRIAELERVGAEWALELGKRQAAEQEEFQRQNATDRANRIARHRAALRVLGERHSIRELIMFADTDDDDVILDFATTVCDAEFGRD